MATMNVSTVRGKKERNDEVMEERKLDVMGLCETRLWGRGGAVIHGSYRLHNREGP